MYPDKYKSTSLFGEHHTEAIRKLKNKKHGEMGSEIRE